MPPLKRRGELLRKPGAGDYCCTAPGERELVAWSVIPPQRGLLQYRPWREGVVTVSPLRTDGCTTAPDGRQRLLRPAAAPEGMLCRP